MPELAITTETLLTVHAFGDAYRHDIGLITKNLVQMAGVWKSSEVDPNVIPVPDLTILRMETPLGKLDDAVYARAHDDQLYVPGLALEGATTDSPPSVTVSKRQIEDLRRRKRAQDMTSNILELTVRDWDSLGKALGWALEDAKLAAMPHGLRKASEHAVGGVVGFFGMLGVSIAADPRTRRVLEAGKRKPYDIKYRPGSQSALAQG